MQKKRHPSSLLVGLVLLHAAGGASAIGWARAQQAAVLGRPLDFRAELRLDPGDVVAPECVAADVAVGERSLPPHLVRLQVDASNPEALVMRVATSTAVEEPLVVVTLAIGCPARMARHFTLLADPPAGAPGVVAAVAERAAATAPPVAAVLGEPPPAGSEATGAMPPPRRPAAAAPAAAAATAALLPPPPRHSSAAPTSPARTQARATPSPSGSSRRAAAAVAPARPSQTGPRLRLDPVETAPITTAAAALAVDDALQAVAQAASAARAAASAASAAEQRIAALERSVSQADAQARAERERAQDLRRRAAAAETGSFLLTPLLLLLLALVLLSGWLGWRLRRARLEREASWRRVVGVEPTPLRGSAPAPLAAEPAQPAPMTVPPTVSPTTTPATLAMQTVPPTVSLPKRVEDSAAVRTQVLPPPSASSEGAARDVSIDELLDLEQQAEFFAVIGQDEAAIDLLVQHLRETGGGSPLPYLKLLEIYRRRGEREAYERIRERFNHRFNAYAPEWHNDLQHGRSLEDYPGVLPRLQQVWPRPLDAMAELEALLFRKSSRGELFELPAYREVLFLYSLARDLLDREAASTGNVDLLLPLADGGEFSTTSPHPYFGLERESVFDAGGAGERPTAPVDFDLSQFEGPAEQGAARKGGR